MKFKLSLLVFALTTCLFAQNKKLKLETTDDYIAVENLGLKAIEEQNYEEAKKIYKFLNKTDVFNPTYNYQLGIIDVKGFGGKEACTYFKKAYTAADQNTKNMIRKFCPEARENHLFFVDEVTELPKIVSKNKTIPFLETKTIINPITKNSRTSYIHYKGFNELVKTNFLTSKDPALKKIKSFIIKFEITKTELKVIEVLNIDTQEKVSEEAKNAFQNVLNANFTFIPATYKNEPVGILHDFLVVCK